MQAKSEYDYDPHTGEYPPPVDGLRDRVRNGVDLMVKELSAKGMNPVVGMMIGSLTGVLNTWLDKASDEQVDTLLAKVESIIAGWRHGEQPTS